MAQPQKTPSPPGMPESKEPSDSGTPTPAKGKAPPFTKKGGMGAPPKGGQSISEGLREAMAGAVKPAMKGK